MAGGPARGVECPCPGDGMSGANRPWPPKARDVLEVYRRHYNDTRNANYEVAEEPDTKERTKPDIDYLLRDTKSGKEIAVEVSSVWRSKDAGMEDAYIDQWFQRMRARVAGRVHGQFRLSLPTSVPRGVAPEAFANLTAAIAGGSRPDVVLAAIAEREAARKKAAKEIATREATGARGARSRPRRTGEAAARRTEELARRTGARSGARPVGTAPNAPRPDPSAVGRGE